MKIQTNVAALNAHLFYVQQHSTTSTSAERLSSGYRINRAADDAAGLAISEKMRAQIRGLKMASKDVQDAVSLVQTAEGALQEVHSILQRMDELSVQAATGTNVDFDRSALDKEFAQLKEEIDDISFQTTFNNIKVLDGSLYWTDTASVSSDAVSGNSGLIGGATSAGQRAAGLGSDITIEAAKASGVIPDQYISHASAKDTRRAEVAPDSPTNPDPGLITHGYSFQFYPVRNPWNPISGYTADFTLIAQSTDPNQTWDQILRAGENDPNGRGYTIRRNAGLWDLRVEWDDVNGATFIASYPGGTAAQAFKAYGGATVSLFPLWLDHVQLIAGSPGTPEVFEQSTASVNPAALRVGDQFDIDDKTYELISADGAVRLSAGGIGIVWEEGASTTADLIAGILASPPTNVTVAASGSTFTITQHTRATVPTDPDYVSTALVYRPQNSEEEKPSSSEEPVNSPAGHAQLPAVKWNGPLRIQTGALENEQLVIAISNTSAAGLGVALHNLSSQETAGHAITAVRQAIDRVSDLRTTLGAQQNRFAYKLSSLGAATENLSASESRIRDVDMAQEMTRFTKSSILGQAATAMLAQANSSPQNVLALLD